MRTWARVLSPLLVVTLAIASLLCVTWALNLLWAIPLALLFSWAFEPSPLTPKRVLVTGGSSGIGRAVARCAAAAGAHVILCARDEQRLAEARREVEGERRGATCSCIPLDVTWPQARLQAALAPVLEQGGVDVLILSAGDSLPNAFVDTTEADWELMLRLNVLGVASVARVFAPGMMARRAGAIVAIGSMAGQVGIYGFSGYSASKFALRGLCEALRMEMAPHGVRVSLVCPPDTDTPLLARENARKPNETRRISEQAGLFSADAVARKVWRRAALAGDVLVGFGADGLMLDHLTVGMLPSNSWLDCLAGLFLLPLFRLIGLAHTLHMDRICRTEARARRASSTIGSSDGTAEPSPSPSAGPSQDGTSQ